MAMFTYNGQNLASVALRSITGRSRVGGFALEFELEFTMLDRDPEVAIVYVDGSVVVAVDGRTVGEFYPQLTTLRSSAGGGNAVRLFLPLDSVQVRALDLSRAAHGDLALRADLRILASGRAGIAPHWQQVQGTISGTQWLVRLQEMRWERPCHVRGPSGGRSSRGDL